MRPARTEVTDAWAQLVPAVLPGVAAAPREPPHALCGVGRPSGAVPPRNSVAPDHERRTGRSGCGTYRRDRNALPTSLTASTSSLRLASAGTARPWPALARAGLLPAPAPPRAA